MRLLILKDMISVSIVSLAFAGVAVGKPTRDTSTPGVMLTKDTTANVEKRLMWLVEASEEHNPPDGNYNFQQMGPESDMLDESSVSNLDEPSIPVSEELEAESDSHINETEDPGATSVHFKMNATVFKGNLTATPASFSGNPVVIRPNLISVDEEEEEGEEEPKPAPKEAKPVPNPYDPTNEGTSKGGRHKGQHLHFKSATAHSIPIIKMGQSYEENSGLTVVKPWNS